MTVGPAYFSVGPGCQVENMGGLLEKYLGPIEEGFFLEIGAYDGLTHSNTVGLVKRGWSGVLVEPNPESASKIRESYAEYPRITLEESAVGREEETYLKLWLAGPLSSTSNTVVERYATLAWAMPSVSGKSIQVKSTTVDALLRKHRPPRLDLVVVDVEGGEEDVFAGFSISHWKPEMIIVELVENHPDFANLREHSARVYLDILAAGYVPIFKDSINTVFVTENRFKQKNLALATRSNSNEL